MTEILRWLIRTPLGSPVAPEVKTISAILGWSEIAGCDGPGLARNRLRHTLDQKLISVKHQYTDIAKRWSDGLSVLIQYINDANKEELTASRFGRADLRSRAFTG